MTNITEDYVSFETAKLLKEKGFRCATLHYYYDKDGDLLFSAWRIDAGKNEFVAPTLQMAMRWLREVHSLYIDIVTSFSQDGICYTFSCFNTMDLIQGTKGTSYHEYQTYEEACEAAIKYCLENLI